MQELIDEWINRFTLIKKSKVKSINQEKTKSEKIVFMIYLFYLFIFSIHLLIY